MRRRDHRIAPAGHITSDIADRDVAMAENDAGQGLDLDIAHRFALDFGEVADLRLREADVVERLRRDFLHYRGDVAVGQAESRRRPVAKALAEVADGAVAARPDIGDDRLDRLARL